MSLSFLPDFLPRSKGLSVTPNRLQDFVGIDRLNYQQKTPARQGRPAGSLDRHPGARK